MSDLVMLPVIDLHPHPDNLRKNVGDVSELAAVDGKYQEDES